MSKMRRAIQDARKRWARHRSKRLAPNKEGEPYRVRTPPEVLDPRLNTGRKR
jgi:hypothetical protein